MAVVILGFASGKLSIQNGGDGARDWGDLQGTECLWLNLGKGRKEEGRHKSKEAMPTSEDGMSLRGKGKPGVFRRMALGMTRASLVENKGTKEPRHTEHCGLRW